MYAGVLLELALCPIHARRLSHRLLRQMLEHPVGDLVAAIVADDKIRIRANVVEARKAVLHDLGDAARRCGNRIGGGRRWQHFRCGHGTVQR